MRFLKIARRPAFYTQYLYATNPSLALLPYEQQFRDYCADFFGPVDTWSHCLRKVGIEATDIIGGIEPLDRAWWNEFGARRAFPERDIFPEQIKQHRPDVLFLEAIESFSVAEIEHFRGLLPKHAIVAGMTPTDLRSNAAIRVLDVVFSCRKGLVAELTAEGRTACFLPHSFDPRVLANFPAAAVPSEDINFIGNIYGGNHLHDFRMTVVKRLVNDHDLAVYSDIETSFPKALGRHAAKLSAFHVGRGLKRLFGENLPLPPRLERLASGSRPPQLAFDRAVARNARKGAYGLRQYELLRRARMALNVHPGIAGTFAANMRLFEATGIGVCLVTDSRSDLSEFFEPGRDVAVFSTPEQASEVVGHLRRNPREADVIAAAGHKRTLEKHTFEQRIPIILNGIEAAREASLRKAS